MVQPVETATDYRHTHKDLGLIMVNVYGFVFRVCSYYRPLRAGTQCKIAHIGRIS